MPSKRKHATQNDSSELRLSARTTGPPPPLVDDARETTATEPRRTQQRSENIIEVPDEPTPVDLDITIDDFTAMLTVNVKRLSPKPKWQAFINVDSHYSLPKSAYQSDDDSHSQAPFRSSQVRKRSQTAQPRRPKSATVAHLQNIEIGFEGDPAKYDKLAALRALQARWMCSKHHQSICYIHPLSRVHRRVNYMQQDR
ncbi:hypothetical protein SAICODRAFT_9536 [Saitoella complicata NRRL Y-17804]|uniref:Uncharacterized protein n=1 Tax=Saitoella complicata (strain BCRC 22490 / CBS 7301 / JCM 7358 / NBRC 10748 / NRRL Y-17804) TaxID=698492 RepID=A0A0E9NEW3_SAICN|nr:uncharacterized protein SAICODRAFT_9536 [Saitoella complicata NRRL Y-17804]ODQ50894.1 hypothetical protein SAICODRAFT_9536 [Saitoella complicata NRRL Y-17804]GAO48387.1 hypothetical protein G7K_2560-t1 [Saitoella complicata NRRL Y-17804]